MVRAELNDEGLKFPESLKENVNINNRKRFLGDTSVKFALQPKFLTVLRSLEEADPNQNVFSYNEILQLLSKYIFRKKETIFDPRNERIALVDKDPLGVAFNVAAFDRSQVW